MKFGMISFEYLVWGKPRLCTFLITETPLRLQAVGTEENFKLTWEVMLMKECSNQESLQYLFVIRVHLKDPYFEKLTSPMLSNYVSLTC